MTDPAEFAAIASVSNMFEIQSSQLVLERAASDEVKAFAKQMIAAHTKAGEDMATAAGEEGVTPASELDQKHQQILDTLGSLNGEAFDTAYIEAQVQAHDEAVALFEAYSANGTEGPPQGIRRCNPANAAAAPDPRPRAGRQLNSHCLNGPLSGADQ